MTERQEHYSTKLATGLARAAKRENIEIRELKTADVLMQTGLLLEEMGKEKMSARSIAKVVLKASHKIIGIEA